MTNLPVVAAIPNYNMAPELERLLPQLAEQDYAEIFVLDDASTDDSRDVVTACSRDIKFIAGDRNKGAGANRNRIIPVLGYDALIHFLDADIVLETERTAEAVQSIVPTEPFGFVGGLAKTPAGLQNVWNYGPRQGLRADIGANLQARIEPLLTADPTRAQRLRHRFSGLLNDWPDPLTAPIRRPVFWNIEQNLVVRSDIFTQLGGFDESLREHEIQDLAIRMAGRGLQRYFDPLISVRHTEGQVREYNRLRAMMAAEFRIAHKHGFRHWLLADKDTEG